MTRTWLQILAVVRRQRDRGARCAITGRTINYDRAKQWTANVVVVEFRYVNPHAQLFFDRRKDDGTVEHFSGELLPNPAQLVRNGWTRKRSLEAMTPGTMVKVTVAPSRAGGEVGSSSESRTGKARNCLARAPNPGGPRSRAAGSRP